MITITDIRSVNHANYDEVWAIVRSLRNPERMKQVPELSPSWDLFKQYMKLRDTGQWNATTFKSIYVPTFLKEMLNIEARKKLSELVELDKQGKRICLVCFCGDETLCHRSIVAGILQYMGIQIQGVSGDYSQYGEAYMGENGTKRAVNYKNKSLKQLLEGYAYEAGRQDQAERENTQNLIKDEIYARIKDMFTMLDADPNAMEQIYKQLIEH